MAEADAMKECRCDSVAVRGSVLVGADGVWSAVRSQKFGDPLRYVGVVLVMGVSPLQHPLLREQVRPPWDGMMI